MPRTYQNHYQAKQEYLTERVKEGDVHPEDAEAIRELCNAFDEDAVTTSKPNWPDAPSNLTQYRADGTLANWMYFLTTYARETRLLDASAQQLNQIAEDWLNGNSPIKEDGISKGTIRAYQTAARIFYRYHDVDVEPSAIATFDREQTGIDPRDMLTPEEVEQVREVPEHPRDQAILDMLLYTGLRNNGLRTLRIKDIDTEEGQYYFNTTAEGLKNIYKPHAPRPLLGAIASVREWLSYHPAGDDPTAYLIMGKPKFGDPDPHSQVSDRTIQRVMDSIKATTSIGKPMHPHMMRHNFVTLCKREYELDDSTVKFLIGHSPDSTVMETTYAHLSAEDHAQKARVGAGLTEPDEESSLTPDFCPTCDEPLGPSAKACSRCGTVFTPDSQSEKERIEQALYQSKGEVEDDELEELVDKLNVDKEKIVRVLLNSTDDHAGTED
jgi:integrase